MRITIDLDTHNNIIKNISKFIGYVLLYQYPNKTRKTRKGFHLIYRNLNITENKMYLYRYLMLDDRNRIRLDRCSNKRIKQVLFSNKKVRYR